jgi:hypothetical protein
MTPVSRTGIALPVMLNGGREYVQGTQMLARASEIVAPAGGTLTMAAFRSITDRQVILSILEPGAKPPKATLGSARYRTADGTEFSVAFIAESERAPADTRPPRCSWRRLDAGDGGALDADFAIEGLGDSEDFLDALIQTIKLLHDAMGPDIRDIWFTGLRNGTVPVGPRFPVAEGLLTLRQQRMMGREGVWQSTQLATLTGSDSTVIAEAAVTFAFKAPELPHAS